MGKGLALNELRWLPSFVFMREVRFTRLRRINPYLASLAIIAAALGAALSLPQQTAVSAVGIVFLMAVLASAALCGLRPALLASLVAALSYDFFFFPPVYSFTFDDWHDALSVFIFLAAAVIVSLLAESLRNRARAARRREVIAKRMSLLNRKLGAATDAREIAAAVTSSVGALFGAKTAVFLPEAGSLRMVACHPRGARSDANEQAQAEASWKFDARITGDTSVFYGSGRTVLPIATAFGKTAVMIVGETRRRFWPLEDRMRLIHLFATQAATAFERIALAKQIEQARIEAQTEKLRSALLASFSHDLKTPLSIILGSANSLKALGHDLNRREAQNLLDTIQEEGELLDQFIANVFDMTRLESEALKPRLQIADINDVIGSVLRRACRRLAQHRIVLDTPDYIPMVELDPVLMEQVLFNILDNAAKYTPSGTEIRVKTSIEENSLVLRVLDEGSGIPSGEIKHLFEKFYRVETGSWKPAGTGLGLAICRGFVEAMGGTISARNREDRPGAVFTIEIPLKTERQISLVAAAAHNAKTSDRKG
jgi:two-component system sensor histidine kinase KdpD